MEENIVNLVATAELGQILSLEDVAELDYTIYDQEIYGGRVAYLKTPKMYGKVTIFPSGKLISIGTRSLEQAQKDLEYLVNYLHSHDLIKPVNVKAKIRNIVAVITIDKIPSLIKIAVSQGAIYEPEQFPGAILKSEVSSATFLIFNSGKIIISGTSSIEELEKSSTFIKNTLLHDMN